ncbi:MAG: 44.4 kDa putative cell membrane-associated protein [Novo Mesto picornavirus 1]|nr:MAG: 44.4 kDa putative cell membrane-associated protein [Novo Mesto picornavirus 1]
MVRFPHPSYFESVTGGDAQLMETARNWQWGTGRPIYSMRTSSAQTAPRFDNSFGTQTQPRFDNSSGTQTYPRFDNSSGTQTQPRFDNETSTQTGPRFDREASTQASIPAPINMSNILLQEANKINVPMSPYERFMANLAPMPRLRTPNMGQAISSGLNAAENEHMYGRVSGFQSHQNELDRAQAAALQQSSFDQANKLQQSQQTFDQGQAERSYEYQSNLQHQRIQSDQQMQQAGFSNQQTMQQNEFGQQRQMQASSQQFQQGMAAQNYGYQTALQNQSIWGSIANTATGGVLGALTEGVHELGEYVNQKSNQNYQERMNPILFDQQKQLQSAQIRGNLENTGMQTLGNLAVSALSNAASVWMNHTNNEFQQAQQTRNFNNAIYASGQSSQALKIAN